LIKGFSLITMKNCFFFWNLFNKISVSQY